ncbi:amino acid/amide ABC transporter substrate-binding protein (HAAT family) [Geothermobacter ehrlichii]|uniref:Amino acid/amide ABC transporter substrate-binding protein (HAAT family) n=1 Tax=Geothermobacter ehrlichii TaxID=213224 RepID=A0A5D3WI33_9BACT|nr:ABC transporter substrate-binding protein [Geothermobacter ehrlichii]TYO96385.1 amino acid/amide ABC transporter substrate-binding protein (HAAT family) [Geothermobacter ehrlichii]
MPRLLFASLLLLLLLLLLAACRQNDPVRIGYLAELNGRYADVGMAGRNGALLAVEDANRKGGIHGHPVELLVRDDRQNPDVVRKMVAELQAAGVAAIVGPMISQMGIAVKPELDRRRLLALSPTVSTSRLDNQDDWFFRLYPSTRQFGADYAAWIRRSHGLDSMIAVIDEANAAYTQTFYQAFSRNFSRLGGRMLPPVTYYSGKHIPFYRLAREIAASAAAGLLILASAMDTAMLCQQLKGLGFSRPTFASEWSGTEDILRFGSSAIEGLIFYNTFDRDNGSHLYRRFVERYRQRFGQNPGFASVHAYDAASILIETLRRNGDPARLKRTLLAIGSFRGLQGLLTFTPTGDIQRRRFQVEIRDGRFRTIDEDSRPASPPGQKTSSS